MKYIIPQDKIEKIVFKYLDLQYGDLKKIKAPYYKGFIFKKPNDDSGYGVMGWEKPNNLYVHYKLIKDISSMFSIEESDSKKIVGKWVKYRYKLKVVGVWKSSPNDDAALRIN